VPGRSSPPGGRGVNDGDDTEPDDTEPDDMGPDGTEFPGGTELAGGTEFPGGGGVNRCCGPLAG
jgi:hypothetical protein